MRKHELQPHTADVRIYACGDNFEELIRAALEGLCDLILPNYSSNNNSENLIVIFKIDSIDSSALVIDFLSEALFYFQTKKAIFNEIRFITLNDSNLEAELCGFYVEEFENDVKAISYSGAEININDDGLFEITIIPDI